MNRLASSVVAALLYAAASLAAADNLSLRQPDGMLLTVIDDGTAGPYQQQLERRNPDGSLDPRFGRGGRVTFSLGKENLGPRALRADPRGRLLVVGAAFGADDRPAPAIVRFLPDGYADGSWGVQGRRLAAPIGEDALSVDVLGMADDSVLLLGQVESRGGDQVALWRLRGDGSPDPGFGRGGVWLPPGLAGAQALGLQGGDDGAALIAVQLPAQGTNWLEVHRWQPGSDELQRIARQPTPRAWNGPVTFDRRNGTLQWLDPGGGRLPLVTTSTAATAEGAATQGAENTTTSLGNAGFNPFGIEGTRSPPVPEMDDDSLQWLGWSAGLLAVVLALAWWQRRRTAPIDLGMLDLRSARNAQLEAAVRGVEAAALRQKGFERPEPRAVGAADGVQGQPTPAPAQVVAAAVPPSPPAPDQAAAAVPMDDAAPVVAAATAPAPADHLEVVPATTDGLAAPAAGVEPGRAGCHNRLPRPEFGEPDDLKRIKGIGPKLERLLHGEGVYYFWQIAEWTGEDVAIVDARLTSFKGRIERDAWVAQASEFARRPDAVRKPTV
jgi:uncharacterized delta-60 repeat protein